MGISCAVVIYKVIDYEMGYDTFRQNYDHIYRVVEESQMPSGMEYDGGAPFPTGNGIRNDFQDVEMVCSVMSWSGGMVSLESKEKFQEELGIAFAEPELIEMFDFEVIHGNKQAPLTNPEEALISESLAAKYFGYDGSNMEEVLGQTVNIDNSAKFSISGIFEDQPEQSDFRFTLLLPYKSQGSVNQFYSEESWEMTLSNNHCYILINENVDLQRLEALFEPFVEKYRSKETSDRMTVRLLPLKDEHFSQRYTNFSERSARKDFLLALSLIGLFLIVTGSVNFINMSTAQSVIRAKEIGIRKVLGGQRTQLITQLLAETFMITFVAVIISLGLAEILFVNLTDILGYRLSLDLLSSFKIPLFLIATLFIVTIMSGLYPSMLLSKTSALNAIRMRILGGKSGGGLNIRRSLVILQFAISQFLIFSTLVINSQMDYFTQTPLGFNTNNIVQFALPENEPQTLELIRNRLMNNANVEAVSFGLGSPLAENNATTGFRYRKSGSDDRHLTNFKPVDEHYIDLFGLEVLAGRKLRASDDSVIVVNETFVEKMGLTNPEDAVGERVEAWGNRNIVGVVSDFHTYSFHEAKIPTVLFVLQPYYYQGQVKIAESASLASIKETVNLIEEVWNEAFPDFIFEYTFLDQFIASQYETESRVSKLYQIFSILAIFIGCLGLYGLIAFIANQKTKEIGIRKVLGATVTNILTIFSKELLVLLVIAFLVATPLAFWTMSDWLNDFTYRVEIGLNTFMLAFAATLIVALGTMGYNSVKSAYANPVKSLRDE